MDKNLLFFIIFGSIAGYFLIDFVHSIDPNNKLDKESISVNKTTNNSFQNISKEEQINLWNESTLKNDVINSYPNFEIMEKYINVNIDDYEFKSDLINKIEEIKMGTIAGDITKEKATKILSYN